MDYSRVNFKTPAKKRLYWKSLPGGQYYILGYSRQASNQVKLNQQVLSVSPKASCPLQQTRFKKLAIPKELLGYANPTDSFMVCIKNTPTIDQEDPEQDGVTEKLLQLYPNLPKPVLWVLMANRRVINVLFEITAVTV